MVHPPPEGFRERRMRNGAAVNGEQGAATWRRIAAVPHRSLRRILFRPAFLVQGLAVAILLNFFLVRMLSSVWVAHSRVVEYLLHWSGVPWEIGRWAEIWP